MNKLCGCNNLNNSNDPSDRYMIIYLPSLTLQYDELAKLSGCSALEELLLVGNPIYEEGTKEEQRVEVVKRLPNLKKLDGVCKIFAKC